MTLDWDKLRIFHAVAEAGSFTHAGEKLNLSQSAVSRQISTLEESLGVPLFHRHARGLVLTEQGELLEKTAHDIFSKLAMIEGRLVDSKQLPEGPLRITTTEFIGATWLAPNMAPFHDEYPDVQLTLLFDDRILNLGMREADAAIRLYKPEQPDLIQRSIASIEFHIYAAQEYLDSYGTPKDVKDLKKHRLIGFPEAVPLPYSDANWLFRVAGIDPEVKNHLTMMNSLQAIFRATEAGLGLAALPDYMVSSSHRQNLKPVLKDTAPPPVEMFFVYPEERKNSQRLAIFRDYLLKLVEQTNF